MPKKGHGESSGKIILMGDHAVVYGEPAIAFPFHATKVVARFTDDTQDFLDSSYYRGLLKDAPHALKNIKVLLEQLKAHHQLTHALHLHLTSTIPAERGMGSSAAVAVAITRAFYNYLSLPLDHDTLLNYVQISEKIAHGNPSGLDAAAASSLKPIYFTKGHPFDYFALNIDAFLIVADTGMKGQTREAVKDVAHLFEKNREDISQHIQKLGKLTKQAKDAIINNQPMLLGKCMSKAHEELQHLTVSNSFLDTLIQTATSAGALGAKLTGGGRGGCMIALTTTNAEAQIVSQALADAGAVNTWIQGLGAHANV
ncbi:MAG: mevalonate kinase [Enterococcus sp.]